MRKLFIFFCLFASAFFLTASDSTSKNVSFQIVDLYTGLPLSNKTVEFYYHMHHINWSDPPKSPIITSDPSTQIYIDEFVTDNFGKFSVNLSKIRVNKHSGESKIVARVPGYGNGEFSYSPELSTMGAPPGNIKGNIRIVKKPKDFYGRILGNSLYNLNEKTHSYIDIDNKIETEKFDFIKLEVWHSYKNRSMSYYKNLRLWGFFTF